MDVPTTEVRAGVFLRAERLSLAAKVLDLTTDAALSRAIGMDRVTISRARDGIIGERFIATVLDYFGEHEAELRKFGVGVKFDDLFEVRRDKTVSI